MVIDMHTHVYPEKIAAKALDVLQGRSQVMAKTNGMKDGLYESSKEAGIDISVILPVATSTDQVGTINENAYKINLSSKRKGLVSFGAVHPDCGDPKRILRGVASLGLKGIKLHPDYQGTPFNSEKYKKIVELATDLGLWIVVHAGVDIGLPEKLYSSVDMILDVLKDTGTDRLILAHMGGWRMWDEVEEKLVGKDVYFDTAFSTPCVPEVDCMMSEEQFIRIVRAHGVHRILFGTDSPWADQKRSLKWIRNSSLTKDEKEKILGRNAERILWGRQDKK